MRRERLDGLYLLLLGSLVFLLLGFALESTAPGPLADFKTLYFPARCLVENHDPYLVSEVARVYTTEGGDRSSDTAIVRQIATQNVYPPTVFLFTALLAILPWGPAHTIWLALTAASFILASFLIWDLGADYSPVLSGALAGFVLANSEVLLITGNAAGLVVSLSAVAVWCFIRERFVPAGMLCLAISLAIKPHDSGLVWLYFLLAGGVYRKRALQTLLMTGVIGLPGVLWVWRVAPHWMQELQFNLQAFSVHGGINDPGLASTGGRGLDMLISLQTAISMFWDDPRIYNPASYAICAVPVLIWALVTFRSRSSPERAWLAIAAIAPLTMLPVYHRQLDAKLLLLTIPGCAMLWAAGGLGGRIAVLINTAGFVATGDIPWAIFSSLISRMHKQLPRPLASIPIDAQMFAVPLVLLLMGIFYLCAYMRRDSSDAPRRLAVAASEPCLRTGKSGDPTQ